MADIKIRIEKRRARNLTPEVKLVTRNEGYTVEFEFDDEWSVSNLKTALFIANGEKIAVPFTGNECKIPMLVGVTTLFVGVKATEVLGLQTTIAAKVDCELSADDLTNEEIEAPSKSVYDLLIEMINAGMLKGDKGDKGDKPQIGVDYWTDEDKKEINDYIDKEIAEFDFVKVLDNLPAVGLPNREYFIRKSSNDTTDLFDEWAWINKGTEESPNWGWEFKGTKKIEVDLADYVKFTDYAAEGKAGVIKAYKTYGFNVNANGIPNTETFSKQKYDSASQISFIGKGTLENIKNAYVKEGITTNTETWTDDEKKSARDLIGAVGDTDYPTADKAGVVKTIGGAGSGIKVENGIISTYPASKDEINNVFYYPAITSRNIGYATKYALVHPEKYTGVSPDWTDEDKAKACETIGAVKKQLNNSANHKAYISKATNGDDGLISVSYNPTPGDIPIMGGLTTTGATAPSCTIPVGIPTQPYGAIPKKYVDDNKGTKLYFHDISFTDTGVGPTERSNSAKIISTKSTQYTSLSMNDFIDGTILNCYFHLVDGSSEGISPIRSVKSYGIDLHGISSEGATVASVSFTSVNNGLTDTVTAL